MTLTRRAGLVSGLALLAGGARTQTSDERVSVGTYQSGDEAITTVVFSPLRPDADMAGAAILLLHGGAGAGFDLERWYPRAVSLAQRGYTVAFPAWFGARPTGAGAGARQRQIVADGATFLRSLPGVDPARVAAFGFSRGGYAACDLAVSQPGVAAVVGVACGGTRRVDEIFYKPPTLLVFSAADPVVDPARSRAWERTLRSAGVPVRTLVLDNDRHVPEPSEWGLVFAEAHAFFRSRLRAA